MQNGIISSLWTLKFLIIGYLAESVEYAPRVRMQLGCDLLDYAAQCADLALNLPYNWIMDIAPAKRCCGHFRPVGLTSSMGFPISEPFWARYIWQSDRQIWTDRQTLLCWTGARYEREHNSPVWTQLSLYRRINPWNYSKSCSVVLLDYRQIRY